MSIWWRETTPGFMILRPIFLPPPPFWLPKINNWVLQKAHTVIKGLNISFVLTEISSKPILNTDDKIWQLIITHYTHAATDHASFVVRYSLIIICTHSFYNWWIHVWYSGGDNISATQEARENCSWLLNTLQKYSPLQSLHNRLDAEMERKQCLRNIKWNWNSEHL